MNCFTVMIRAITLCTFYFCSHFSNGQITNIPDSNFEQALINLGYDAMLDGSVLTSNISGITSLDVHLLGISDLTGIEDFTALEFLDCASNPLGTLDITQNTSLTHLFCNNCQLTSLNVTQNTYLDNLFCSSNLLTSLDVTQNALLKDFDINYNQITALNLTLNPLLSNLYCGNNPLSTLDLSQNPDITGLRCQYSGLTSLDLSQNLNLVVMNCGNNQITTLDLSQHSDLLALYCSNAELICLNVKNGNNLNMLNFDATGNPNLWCIEVDDVAWSNVTWADIDVQTGFSNYCDNSCTTGLKNISVNEDKPIKILDVLGRETKLKSNTSLIYYYSNGTSKMVFIVE